MKLHSVWSSAEEKIESGWGEVMAWRELNSPYDEWVKDVVVRAPITYRKWCENEVERIQRMGIKAGIREMLDDKGNKLIAVERE